MKQCLSLEANSRVTGQNIQRFACNQKVNYGDISGSHGGKDVLFWYVTPYEPIGKYRRFDGTRSLHLQN
jgi:hypothetical protein